MNFLGGASSFFSSNDDDKKITHKKVDDKNRKKSESVHHHHHSSRSADLETENSQKKRKRDFNDDFLQKNPKRYKEEENVLKSPKTNEKKLSNEKSEKNEKEKIMEFEKKHFKENPQAFLGMGTFSTSNVSSSSSSTGSKNPYYGNRPVNAYLVDDVDEDDSQKRKIPSFVIDLKPDPNNIIYEGNIYHHDIPYYEKMSF